MQPCVPALCSQSIEERNKRVEKGCNQKSQGLKFPSVERFMQFVVQYRVEATVIYFISLSNNLFQALKLESLFLFFK